MFLIVEGTTSCGNAYAKTYYISHVFKTHWTHARSICQSYGMEFLSLETLQEQNSFFKLCENKADLFEDWTFIGGYTIEGKSLDKWYWVNSGKRIDYSLTFGHGMPDFGWNQEFCLCLGKQTKTFFMNDALCQGFEKKFICQKEDF